MRENPPKSDLLALARAVGDEYLFYLGRRAGESGGGPREPVKGPDEFLKGLFDTRSFTDAEYACVRRVGWSAVCELAQGSLPDPLPGLAGTITVEAPPGENMFQFKDCTVEGAGNAWELPPPPANVVTLEGFQTALVPPGACMGCGKPAKECDLNCPSVRNAIPESMRHLSIPTPVALIDTIQKIQRESVGADKGPSLFGGAYKKALESISGEVRKELMYGQWHPEKEGVSPARALEFSDKDSPSRRFFEGCKKEHGPIGDEVFKKPEKLPRGGLALAALERAEVCLTEFGMTGAVPGIADAALYLIAELHKAASAVRAGQAFTFPKLVTADAYQVNSPVQGCPSNVSLGRTAVDHSMILGTIQSSIGSVTSVPKRAYEIIRYDGRTRGIISKCLDNLGRSIRAVEVNVTLGTAEVLLSTDYPGGTIFREPGSNRIQRAVVCGVNLLDKEGKSFRKGDSRWPAYLVGYDRPRWPDYRAGDVAFGCADQMIAFLVRETGELAYYTDYVPCQDREGFSPFDPSYEDMPNRQVWRPSLQWKPPTPHAREVFLKLYGACFNAIR